MSFHVVNRNQRQTVWRSEFIMFYGCKQALHISGTNRAKKNDLNRLKEFHFQKTKPILHVFQSHAYTFQCDENEVVS